MKKLGVLLTLTLLISMLAACGSASPSDTSGSPASSQPAASSQSTTAEEKQTDVLYAVFGGGDVTEYPIEYTGAQKTAEGLADELSKLTGLDFAITTSKADDGLIVDWSADSTLLAGPGDREQKEEFFFYDQGTLSWFMMDSLWRTLTENLDAENIYYTMDGGQELILMELYPSIVFSADDPYMGSDFYFSHADVQGDENLFAGTKGLWRLDGTLGTATIMMDGCGGFTMYYASGAVETAGYLECVDEYEDGNCRYDCYTYDGEWIASFYFDSESQIHFGNDDGAVYQPDMMPEEYLGFWEYPSGDILEISGGGWNIYAAGESEPYAWGPMLYDEEAAYLMNEDGSSGGGKVCFNENGELVDSGNVLTYLGLYYADLPNG